MNRTLGKLIICLALCPAATTVSATSVQAQNNRKITMPWAKKKAMERSNRQQSRTIDSLINVIEEYRSELEHERETVRRLEAGADLRLGRTGAGLFPEEYTIETSDSLLDLWYEQRLLAANHEGEGYDMETVHFTSGVPDSVYKDRLENMNSFITLPFNETVRNNIILYSEKMPTKMGQMLGVARYYMPIFEETFDRYGLPEELKYMAVIESALNPVALSRAGAAGIWQFMHQTGKSYGLHIDSFVDERYDVVKAADAAARYLKDAYDIFGDWALAISSYNCGAGNVNKAIRRSGSREFWKLYPYLPRETRGYVPAFVGAMYAFRYHKECGLTPDPVSMPAHVDTIEVHRMLHFNQISEVVGIPEQTLKDLNPQYKHGIIPGKDRTYILRIPYNYTSAFIRMEDSVYVHKEKELFSQAVLDNIRNGGSANSEQIVYRVKKGDYLGKIASRNHVTVNQIKKWNNLKSNNLSIGQKLIIYRKGTSPAPKPVQAAVKPAQQPVKETAAKVDTTVKAAAADSSLSVGDSLAVSADSSAAMSIESAPEPAPEQPKEEIYVVRKGDTLYAIASRYPGISAKDIMEFNKVGANIKPGMKLRIPVRNQ